MIYNLIHSLTHTLTRVLMAQLCLSGLCTLQGLGTLAIDFNRTHATNPLWTGHARFHLVWQSITVAVLSALELWLIWWNVSFQRENFYLALLLAAVSPLGFLAAFAARRIFGGTLSDQNGIPPAHLYLFGAVRSVDMNLVAVVTALVALAAIYAIYSA